MVKLTCRKDLKVYCKSNLIKIEDFNEPVEIAAGADCNEMFYGCKSFNQPVAIPNSVKICERMFYDCESFNQSIFIPNSVTNCNEMFEGCISFNQPVTIPDGVKGCFYMFSNCKSFN